MLLATLASLSAGVVYMLALPMRPDRIDHGIGCLTLALPWIVWGIASL